MATELSKDNLELVLMQAMMAVKNVRAQRHRLLLLQRRLQRHQAGANRGELASDLWKIYYLGLEAGAKMLSVCLDIAIDNRAIPDIDIAFALMPDEQHHDALLAQRLPSRPTSQAQAFARVEAALLAVKMLEEHHLPRCVECLVGGRAPVPGKPSDASPDRDDDPVSAAATTEGITKVDLSDDPDATAIAKTGKPRHAASGGGGGDVDKALDYLHRAKRITSLAVKHIDLAVAVFSLFLDPKEVARLAELTDKHACLGVEISEPTTSPDPSTD